MDDFRTLWDRRVGAPFSAEQFQSPPADLRGVPFWSWNCGMTREMITEQAEMFRDMGFGGVFIHSRTGMEVEYLSQEFFDLVLFAKAECERLGLRVWLYDEDRWPSGAAGGKVTRDGAHRAEYLLFTHRKYGQCENAQCSMRKPILPGRGGSRNENGTLLACYDVELDEDGCLLRYAGYRGGEPRGELWYAYLEQAEPSAWFNGSTYINVLDADAVAAFTQVTHEAYKSCLGEALGREIPAFFTDEPQHVYMQPMISPQRKNCIFLPWSRSFAQSFRQDKGYDILDRLPEVVFQFPSVKARYDYHNHVADLFARNYCGTLADWCRKNSVMLTGHLMFEPTLQSQTLFIGDAMRCYPLFDLPGMDILADAHEYNTAKQVQSVSHQLGAPGVISELYGKSGWDYDFRGHKLQGDWQAALGVTLRVPHLFWASIKGESKRDYPASIGYQSPWWKQYPIIEDHFARVACAMTRGIPLVRVGIIHPIESMYLHWGPESQTAGSRETLDSRFAHLTQLLLFHLIDFDFICEATLPDMNDLSGQGTGVGRMEYDVIVVPACETLRSTTVAYLEKCLRSGKRVLFLGGCPRLVDGVPAVPSALRTLYEQAERLDFQDETILRALEPYAFVRCRNRQGSQPAYLLHQVRRDGEDTWVFLARGKNPESPDEDPGELLEFTFTGVFDVEELDTLTGKTRQLPANVENGRTVLLRHWFLHDSLLLRLKPRHDRQIQAVPRLGERLLCLTERPEYCFEPVRLRLDEPNAAVLDMAQYALDGGEYRPVEELLRLDNLLRRELGLPQQSRDVVQPYCLREEKPGHTLRLKFTFYSELWIQGTHLALEDRSKRKIFVNGVFLSSEPDGWYVDKAIETVPLPPLQVGENTIELELPFGKGTFTEWCYLLGDFGVRVEGIRETLTAPVRRAAFGSLTGQGLPFYTGNLTYAYDFQAEGNVLIRIPRYRGACAAVRVDGSPWQSIVCSPYAAEFHDVGPGKHTLEIKLYNTRQNGFGPLHFTGSIPCEQHPNAWRTTGGRWTYEYQLKEYGVLSSPEIYRIEAENG